LTMTGKESRHRVGSDQVAAKRDGVEELAVGVARTLHPAIDSRCSIGAPDGWECLYGRSREPGPDPN